MQVLLTKTAQKDLTRIPKDRRSQVLQALRALESWPLLEGMDITRLKGYEEKIYRLRIGDYRVYSSSRKTLSTSYAWFPGRNWKKFCAGFALEEVNREPG